MSSINLNKEDKQDLLKLARESIAYHYRHHDDYELDKTRISEHLSVKACCFVTLKNAQGELAGCIGALEAYQSLADDVCEHALAAATRDFRFSPMNEDDFNHSIIEISVLTPKEPISANSEQELFAQLRPNIDGLIIEDGRHRATFLPKVWEQLPDKTEFLQHLKQKAGLTQLRWGEGLSCYRYQAIDFSERDNLH